MVILSGGSILRFTMYDKMVAQFANIEDKTGISSRLMASSVSAVLLTTAMYPLDLCHTRMSTDMTKKVSLYT